MQPPRPNRRTNRPIRLYGVIPIMVENPDTRLEPVIEMPDVWNPVKK
ncbi:MAG: hypothetical protein WDO14_03515 [Bacteroidota bacterium]